MTHDTTAQQIHSLGHPIGTSPARDDLTVALHRAQPLERIVAEQLRLRVHHQGVRLHVRPPDAAAELVELREACARQKSRSAGFR